MKTPLLSYLFTFGTGLALCFGLQAALLHRAGGRSVKSESNFFSSVARLQAGTRDSPQILMLGSSMTGRLPDRSRGFAGVANLGCDGGSAVEILRALDHGDLPLAPLLIIEGNTLHHGFEMQHSPVADELKTWTFRSGAKVPALGASGRPSALVYSAVMERKLGGGDTAPDGALLHPITHPAHLDPGATASLSASQEPLLQDLVEIARRLQGKGSRLAVVMLPGAPVSPEIRTVAEEFARRSGISYWDLGAGIAKDEVKLTDGVHMAPASAAAAMRTILQELKPP
jgi:hypothetical protein